MPVELKIALISGVVAIITGLVSAWWSSRNMDKRAQAQNSADFGAGVEHAASALEIMQRTISDQAQEMDRIRKGAEADVALLRESVEELRHQVDELKANLTQRDHWIRDLIDWVRRLIFQIKSLDHIPVPFRTVYPDVDEKEVIKRVGGGS